MPLPEIGCLPGQKGDFTGQTLFAYSAQELSNRTIEGICLSQETPNRKVFPDGVTGLVLKRCNLANCVIPAGVTAEADCDKTRFFQFIPDEATYPEGTPRPDGPVDLKVNALGQPLKTGSNCRPMTPAQFAEGGWSMTAAHYVAARQWPEEV